MNKQMIKEKVEDALGIIGPVWDVSGRGRYLLISVNDLGQDGVVLIVHRFPTATARDKAYKIPVPCSGTCRAHYLMEVYD